MKMKKVAMEVNTDIRKGEERRSGLPLEHRNQGSQGFVGERNREKEGGRTENYITREKT